MDANLEEVLGPWQLETCRARHPVAEHSEFKLRFFATLERNAQRWVSVKTHTSLSQHNYSPLLDFGPMSPDLDQDTFEAPSSRSTARTSSAQRRDLHLFHCPPAVHLHGLFHGAEPGSDLFVQQALRYELHHLAFAWRERCGPRTKGVEFGTLVSLQLIARQGLFDGAEQVVVHDGLGEEIDRASFHSPNTGWNIAVPRDKDDREFDATGVQFILQVQPVQAGHLQVQHDARGA